jgi:parallel beta-helix repeat protein
MFVVGGPPSSGDWIVNGKESYSDQTIVLNGNLIVENGGNLTFRKVTLKMNCTYDAQYRIEVRAGGKFYVLDGSVITAVDHEKEFLFDVHGGTIFRMNSSELHECGIEDGGSGLRISYAEEVVIENSLLSNNWYAIMCSNCNPVIRNNNISWNRFEAVSLDHSNGTIEGNHIENNGAGIRGDYYCSPVVRGNTVVKNGIGIHFYNNCSPIIQNNTLTANENCIMCVNSNPTIQSNDITANNNSGISLSNSNPTIQDNNISQNAEGIRLDWSKPLIQNNAISSNRRCGIEAYNSNATIKGNNITGHFPAPDWGWGSGILCFNNSAGAIEENSIAYNFIGITCYWYSSPSIDGNRIISNECHGVTCSNNSNPTIRGNTISQNNETGIIAGFDCTGIIQGNVIAENKVGIELGGNSLNNVVYHNNFLNNTEQTTSRGPLNVWDNGAEGNYWSDYNGVDSNGDGIGDTLLPHLGIDNFPLVQLWSETRTFNAYAWKGVTYPITTQSNNTIASFDFSISTKQVSFNATGPSSNVGYCNVTIPKALLQGNPYQVSVDEKSASNISVTETADETSIYFVYNLTTHRAKITGTQVLDVISPLADAGPDQTVNEDTVITLDGSGSHDNVGIVDYTWRVFDVTTKILSGMKPTYVFNTPGKYTVTLNVTDAIGNWNTSSALITVLDTTPPTANAGQNQTTLQEATVTLDASKSDDNVAIVQYSWDLGDGTSQTGVTINHTYSNPGPYVVTLTVTDAAGNTGTDTTAINVRARGVITLTPSTGLASTTIAGSRFSNNSRITITWDGTTVPSIPKTLITDGNGNFTALISVPTQTSPGVHTVNATDETGNWNTATFTVVDVTGPQGPKGDTGQQGSQGPQGPQGPSANIQDLLILVALPTIVAVLAICLATVALLKKRS